MWYTNFKYLILKFASHITPYCIIMGTLLGLFLDPIAYLIVVITLLCGFDMLTAILVVLKNHGWPEVRSEKMQASVTKLFWYYGLIIIAHTIDLIFFKPVFEGFLFFFFDEDVVIKLLKLKFAAVIGGLIVMIEFYSLDENFKLFRGYSFIEQCSKVASKGLSVIEKINKLRKKDDVK